MALFLLRRIGATVPILAIVAAIVFFIIRLTPGDPAAILAGDTATPETVAAIRARLGLDQPIALQFALWVVQLLRGDFGTSIVSNQPVLALVSDRAEPTLSLALATIVASVAIGIPLGVLAAWRQGSWIDRATMSASVIGFALPGFVLGYLLVYIFALKLRWLPVQGFSSLSDGLGEFAAHIALPTATLSFVFVALIARVTRAGMLDVLGQDFVRTARAKGLPDRAVLLGHALRNAAIPIVSVIGIGIAFLIGGVVVTESVFNLPGLGRLTVESVLARDYPVVQGIILIFSALYVLVNLAIDLSYALFDPRITY